MNLLTSIIERLNQRAAVGNIFDQIYGLCELYDGGQEKAWVHYIGNGQAVPVTNYDAKQGTLFWAKRGKTTVTKTESLRVAGCKTMYETRFPLTAYAVVRKSHLPCDSAEAQDWIASRVYKLVSGTDPQFKTALGVVNYEVTPNGYTNEIKQLPPQFEWASVTIEMDVIVTTFNEDGCYDTCATGDIPLPDFEPCTPCLTEVAVDGVTIIGNGTAGDPLTAIGGGGGTPLTVKDEGTNVSTNTTTLNFTGDGVTASLTSPGVVEVNIPSGGGGGGVTDVTATLPITSSGGATPDIAISQANASNDGYLSLTDWITFDSKQDTLSAGTGIDITANVVSNTAPDQVVSLTGGTGISTSGTYPSFTIDNTAPDQIVSLTAGTGIAVSGTYPSFTIDNTQSTSGFVPYTGATSDVDLGTHNLTADHIALNVSPSGAGFVVGATEWNNTIGSSQTLLKGGNVILKNGVDLVARIVNKVTPNTTLTKAAYQAVRVSGATGGRLSVSLAKADTDNNSADTIGLVIETIATNQEGFIMTVGQLLDINTTGSLQGETWADGDVLYLSPITAGQLTNIKPTGATGHIVVMGYVEYAHINQGIIYVKVMNGWELDELHNVYINSPANNDALIYESSTQLWKNKTIAAALGYTPVSTARTISTSTPLSGGGDLSANRTLSIADAAADGSTKGAAAFTANDFNSASGVISIDYTNGQAASASNKGFLTSTDWSTFNGKFNTPTGTTAQYIRGDGTLATLPAAPTNYKSTTDGTSITLVATEQISASQLITANTFAVGDILNIAWRCRKTGVASSPTFKLYVNTTASLVGATQLAIGVGNQTAAFSQLQRTLIIKSATNTEVLSAAANVFSDFTFTSAVTAANINWTVDQYLIFMCQLSTATADTVRTSYYLIEKI